MHLFSLRHSIPTTLTLLLCLAVSPASFAADSRHTLEESPQYGIFYDRYSPAFYTGFAPRTLEAKRLHVHIGRGNQLRATVVLSDEVLRGYARELMLRHDTYRALIDSGRLVPEQNHGFDDFARTIAGAKVAPLIAEERSLTANGYRDRNLALLERLNPGRVFRIHLPVDEVIRRWLAELRPQDAQQMDSGRQLEVLNLMLPTRIFVAEMDAATAAQLGALVQRSLQSAGSVEAVRKDFVALLERTSQGIYPVRGGTLDFVEFTAIYPIGTWNQTTTLRGRQIPQYPTPGRRALTTHQRTRTEDHVPDDVVYSWFPWLPYMHVGTRMHNALHTLFWRLKPEQASFLPAKWREARNSDGKPWQYLWLLSRGPMSHGCTHVNAGHISELRQLLPSESKRLAEVDVFYNTSELYDVFDIDGDFEPEVMGVRYFIAYSLKNDRPDHLRVRNERHAYYDWLYGGELAIDSHDLGSFSGIKDCRFAGRKALPGREYDRLRLYEAEYEPEKIQFYRMVDVDFAKELRRVDLQHPFPGLDTLLAMKY